MVKSHLVWKLQTNEFLDSSPTDTNLESKDGEDKHNGRGDSGSDDDGLSFVQHAHLEKKIFKNDPWYAICH